MKNANFDNFYENWFLQFNFPNVGFVTYSLGKYKQINSYEQIFQ